MSLLEILGFITGVVGVWLTAKQSIWCWSIAILNVSLYTFIFYDAQLYADMGLQVFYIGMSLYGWYYWLNGRKNTTQDTVPVTIISFSQLCLFSLLTLAGTLLLGYLLQSYTNAALPYIDSFCTCVSLFAQWMQARKKLENWLIWVLVDLVYIALYLAKALYLTALLYAIFVALAIAGYQTWRRSLKLQS